MVNDIVAVNPRKNFLIKFSDDIIFSFPIKPNAEDPSISEVQNIKCGRWLSGEVQGNPFRKPCRTLEPKKSKLKLLGVTFKEHPCNWDTEFDHMFSKASSRLYISRACKYYGYSKEELTILFDSLNMSLFTHVIEVWACAYDGKYLAQIDTFCKRAEKYV